MTADLLAGRYHRLATLGRGAMGEVWLAEDQLLGRRVAVKQLRLDLVGDDPNAIERIGREARVAARLQHPNIVGVYDLVTDNGQPYVIMEYVEGETLSDRLKRGPLDVGAAAAIFAQVARALDAAHRAGVVHRDVKPANILLTPGGDAKLADFGIARGHGDAALTETGHTIGTVAFMSPEIARGADATAASDMWSLGAALFAAVEGHSPHGGTGQPSAATLLVRLVTEPVPAPRVAGPLAPLLGRLLAADPAARPGAGDVARDLAGFANDPTSTVPRSQFAKAEPAPVPPAEQTVTVGTGQSWAAPPPPSWGPPGDGPATTSAATPAARVLAAHAALWAGFLLLVTLVTNWTFLQRAFYAYRVGYFDGGLHLGLQAGPRIVLGLFEVVPLLAAALIVGGTVQRRLLAAGAAVAAAVAQYVLWSSGSSAVWVVSTLVVLLVLGSWLVARGRGTVSFVLLAPAALFAALFYYPHGTGPWLQDVPRHLGLHGDFWFIVWFYAPFLVAGIAGLIAAFVGGRVVAPVATRLGLVAVAGLAAATLVAGLIAQTGFDHTYDYTAAGGEVTDGAGYTTLDDSSATSAVDDLFSAMESGGTAAGCNGSIDPIDLRNYEVGDVTPQSSGEFEVTSTVTLNDGRSETVTVLVGTDSTDNPCVVDGSLREYVSEPNQGLTDSPSPSETPTPAAAAPADVPSVPTQGDSVPTDASLPDPPADDALAYDDSGRPTTQAQIVEYHPSGLTADQAAAIGAVTTFMVDINRQHLAAAYELTDYGTLGGDLSAGEWSGGWITSAFYQVAFGEPVRVTGTLMIVPSRWISRQDPNAQTPTGDGTCNLWPQFLFLMKKLPDGSWVWAQHLFGQRPDVQQYARQGVSGKYTLNPSQQKRQCDAPAPPG